MHVLFVRSTSSEDCAALGKIQASNGDLILRVQLRVVLVTIVFFSNYLFECKRQTQVKRCSVT